MDLIEVTQDSKPNSHENDPNGTKEGQKSGKQMRFVLIETPTFYISEVRDEFCSKLTKYDADVRQLIQSAD
jgi:hypothetical protein